MSDVRWEPVIDSRGFDRDQDGNIYAYCRAVPVTWSQEPPDAEGWWWMGEPEGDVTLVRIVFMPLFTVDGPWALVAEFPCGESELLGELVGMWWLPATVPQPPGEVKP